MRIVQVAPCEEPVPPAKYGGTELVVYNVTEGLVARGHEVFLLAAGGSTTSAKLVPLTDVPIRAMHPGTPVSESERNYWKFSLVSDVLKNIKEIKPDIIHNHLSWRLICFKDHIESPMVSTMHGPLTSFNEAATFKRFPKENYVSISNNQRKALPDLNWVQTVYNGIDVNKFELGEGKGGYFAFLGRTAPEKGLGEIVKMIKNSPYKLKIGAKVDVVDQAYFDTEVKPYVDGEQIEFLGELDHAGKTELLKNATGMLLWLNWEEPFGLAITESMACGTPVIVNPRGSMPELIVDGKTGFLVNSIDEMKAKMGEIQAINRADCREHVVKNFSIDTMVDQYVSLYETLSKKA